MKTKVLEDMTQVKWERISSRSALFSMEWNTYCLSFTRNILNHLRVYFHYYFSSCSQNDWKDCPGKRYCQFVMVILWRVDEIRKIPSEILPPLKSQLELKSKLILNWGEINYYLRCSRKQNNNHTWRLSEVWGVKVRVLHYD